MLLDQPTPDWSRKHDWAEMEENCKKQRRGKGHPLSWSRCRGKNRETWLCAAGKSVNYYSGCWWLGLTSGCHWRTSAKEVVSFSVGQAAGACPGVARVMPPDAKRWEGWKGCSVKKQRAGTGMTLLSLWSESCVPDPVPCTPRHSRAGAPHFCTFCTQLPLHCCPATDLLETWG